MPFPIELKFILEAEKESGFEFPEIFKAKMQEENGGEVYTSDGDYWKLIPFFDKSDKKRISRTCNHILLETKEKQDWINFPKKSFKIGDNGSGDCLILMEKEPNKLGDEIFIWEHETGEYYKVANNIRELEDIDFDDEEDDDF